MSEKAFKFIFDGPAFADHQIDVADLAPALLALGNVVKRANQAINGDRAEARLMVKATAEGSFDAILSIDVSFVAAMVDLIDQATGHKERIATAKELTDLLINTGTIGAGVGGFFWALKKLRGKRPDEINNNDNGTTTIVSGDQIMIVDNRTVILLGDHATREATEEFGKKLERIPGLAHVRFADDDPNPEVVLEKSDLQSLQIPEPLEEEPVETTSEREAWLKIMTAGFRNGYVWRFNDGGEKSFTATVTDEDFFKKVANGDIALSANDTLLCLIIEKQVLSGNSLSKEIEIAKVLKYVPGPKQMRLL